MVELSYLQLILIIFGSIWLGGIVGLFVVCACAFAKEADRVSRRHWLEDEP